MPGCWRQRCRWRPAAAGSPSFSAGVQGATSGGRGRHGRWWSCGMLRALEDDPPFRPVRLGVQHHGDDDRAARDRHLPEGRDIHHWQRIRDDAQEQRPQQRTPPPTPIPPMIDTPPITQEATTVSSNPPAMST